MPNEDVHESPYLESQQKILLNFIDQPARDYFWSRSLHRRKPLTGSMLLVSWMEDGGDAQKEIKRALHSGESSSPAGALATGSEGEGGDI